MPAPAKLYKYVPFGVYALRAITEAEVYHSSPEAFNDPMDCQPSLMLNIDNDSALKLMAKMQADYGLTQHDIDQHINHMRYQAQNYVDKDGDAVDASPEAIAANMRYQLENYISQYLRQEMSGRGVLALSETYASVLMWSHYADHHRGLCLEYDTTLSEVKTLGAVDYNAARAILADDLFNWKIWGNEGAKERVLRTYFYAKSGEWQYEREWRDVNPKAGPNTLPFQLSGVHFGMRVDQTVQQTIIKLLSNNRDVELYNVWVERNSFNLKRSKTDRDYFEQSAIREPPHVVFRRFPRLTGIVLPDGTKADG